MSSLRYTDDDSIEDSDSVWRRIPPWHLVPDGKGGIRASSAAFEDHLENDKVHPMSVHLESVLYALGWDARRVFEIAGCEGRGFRVARIAVGKVRELDQGIQRDPTRADPSHALVFAKSDRRRKTKSVSRTLQEAFTWVSDVDLRWQ